VRAQDNALVFTTWRTDLPGATQFRTSIDTLRIPQQHVAAFEERRLSVGRTAILVAGIAGVVALAFSELGGIGGGSEGGQGGGVFFTAPLRLPLNRGVTGNPQRRRSNEQHGACGSAQARSPVCLTAGGTGRRVRAGRGPVRGARVAQHRTEPWRSLDRRRRQ